MGEVAGSRHRLAAILAADVAGYTRLMAEDEGSTIESLEAARQVFREFIRAHQGRVIDMAGDSVLAVFDSTVSAVTAALEVQTALESSAAGVPEVRRMRFRVGVHLGDITEKTDGSVYGEGVNMAARLEGLALPGGVTVSDAVRSSVRNRVDATFEDLGEKHVKNVEEPIRTFRVRPKSANTSDSRLARWLPRPFVPAQVGVRWWLASAGFVLLIAGAALLARHPRSSSVVEPPLLSVAVLPLRASGEPSIGQLAQTLTVELNRRLAQTVTGHSVKSAASVQAYRGDVNDPGAVGRELDVRYVVQGDVSRTAGQITVTAELVDTRTRAQAWSANFAVSADNPDGALDILALRVLSQLRPALYEAQAKSLPRSPADDASALELAFRGLFFQSSIDYGTQIKASTEECDAALRLDPTLALALWCKAWVSEMLLFGDDPNAHGSLDDKRLAEMDDLSARAVAMDRSDADIWNMRANVLRYQRKWDAVAEARKRALELNPALLDAYIESARDLTRRGQPDKALTSLMKASEVQPGIVKQDDFLIAKCRAHLGLGEYEKSIESCEKLASGGFGRIGWRVFLAVAYAQVGQIDKAIAARDRAIADQRGLSVATWRSIAVTPSDVAAYVEQVDHYIIPGMRKAGFPEK